MSFRKSLEQTVNSFIRNFAPWGIFASLVSAFIAFKLVGRIFPDASGAMSTVAIIVGAIAICLVGVVVLAILVALLRPPKADPESHPEQNNDI